MDSPSQPTTAATGLARIARWLIAGGVLAYAWMIYTKGSPFAAGSDSSGYLNSARLLASGKFTVEPREIPGCPPPWRFNSHIPLGFVMQGESRMAPTYPIGLPLHLAALAPLVGWEKTARVVNVCNVLAAGALLYALGRQLGLRRGWALAGIAALWLSPLWTLFALQPLSDTIAVTWSLAAILCAVRSRERWRWSVLAGAALGVAVLVRPVNLVLALPLLIALGATWRAWIACGVGGLPFGVVMFYYNARTYGSSFTTGYGFVGDAFESRYIAHNLAHFLLWVPLLVGVPVALAAVALPWKGVRHTTLGARTPWLLGAWLITFVSFYVSYWCAGETWWYVRFLLPAFPAVILAGLLVLQRVADRGLWPHRVAIATIVVSLFSQRLLAQELIGWSIRDGERRYYLACQWLNGNLPANAIVASCQLSGAQYYYTSFPVLRWDQVPRDEMEKIIAGVLAAKRPLYASLFNVEQERAMRDHLPGRWTKLHEVDDAITIWQLADAGR